MKSIVVFDEYNEIDLKPSNLLQKYMDLTKKDVASFLVSDQQLTKGSCPGCQEEAQNPAFEKFGLTYVECPACRSLYVSPKPSFETLDRFYRESKARNFWRDELSKMTDKKRKEKIFKPRFQWIVESTQEYFSEASHLLDMHTDQYGYLGEMADSDQFQKKTLLNPHVALTDEKLKKAIQVIDGPISKSGIDGQVDVISLFEVIDRTADVDELFNDLSTLLKPGGLCFITSILISGFALQVLWDRADNIFPPDRLNLLSVEGMNALFERHGFECLEFSTPGVLDTDIVDKFLQQHEDVKLSRFVNYLLTKRDEKTKKDFQEFLQENLMSSYGRILIQKK